MTAIDGLSPRFYITVVETDPCGTGLTPVDSLESPRIFLTHGYLVLNGIAVPEAVFSNKDRSITFRQEVPGIFRAGKIYFNSSADRISGYLVAGANHFVAQMVTFVGHVSTNVYKTELAENSDQQPGPGVSIGYKMKDDGEMKAILKVGEDEVPNQLQTKRDDQSTVYTQLSSSDTLLLAETSFGDFPVSFKITVSPDSARFKGTFEKMVGFDDERAPITKSLPWVGQLIPHRLLTPPVYLNDESAGVVPYASHPPLSIMDLWSLSVEPDGVQEKSQNLLIRNMKYCMDSTKREELLGVSRPQMGRDEPGTKSLQFASAKQFYGTDFAYGYLGTAFHSSSPSDRHKVSEDEGWKLRYYMNKGIAELPAYTEHTQSLYLDAYLLKEKRLQDYIDDQNKMEDKEYWAKQYYDVLTSDRQMNITVSNYFNEVGDPFELFRVRCTVLNLLQPSGELAAKAQEIFNGALLTKFSNEVDMESDLTMEWLPDAIEKFIESYLKNPDISEASDQEKSALMEAAKEAKSLSYKFGGPAGFARNIHSVIKETTVWSKLLLPAKVNAWAEAFEKAHPKLIGNLTSLKSLFLGLTYCGSIASLAMAIYGWDSFQPEQQAQLIIDAVTMSGNILVHAKALGSWAADRILGMSKVFSKIYSKSTNALLSAYRKLFKVGSYDLVPKMASKLSRYFDKVSKKIVVKFGDALAKISKGAEKLLKYLGPVIALAAAGFSAFKLYTAIKDGSDAVTIAMRALITTTAIMESIFLTLKVAYAFSWAGPAALVCAVIGSIAGLVIIFRPKPPPLTAAEKFILNDLTPFLEDKQAPPIEWKKDWDNKEN